MTNFYKRQVIKGTKKWTEIPDYWQDKVKAALEADGYVLNKDGTVTAKESAA